MTRYTTFFLQALRKHIGSDPVRRKSLIVHCEKAMGRKMHRGTLSRYLMCNREPGADVLIPMQRWAQLEGLITPAAKEIGLFEYATKAPAAARKQNANKTGRTAPKAAAQRARK